jgi:predicted GH43/DUF377 family glycosyl hydrolase
MPTALSKRRYMFKWEKLGRLFDPKFSSPGGWMHEFAQSPSAVVMDDHVRVFFCSRPPSSSDGMFLSYLAYVDLDRSDPRKVVRVCREPLMQLGGLGTFDEFGTNPVSVISDGAQLRAYYAGWTRCESVPINGAIGLAVSDDGGNRFHRLGPGPVLSYSPDEPFMLGSPRIRRFGELWVLWYVSGKAWVRTLGSKPEPVYKIRMATSHDGIDWRKEGRDLIEDRLGNDECQACADVTLHEGRFHMFFSYRRSHNYKVGEGGYRIGYASSDDMLHWKRQDERAGMHVSAEGWDSQMVSYPHVFILDGQFYMLYQGNEMGRAGFGLARLSASADWSSR